jgi:DUF917 family protein
VSDLPDLARGAAFLGTGGGGNPYIGRLRRLAASWSCSPWTTCPMTG